VTGVYVNSTSQAITAPAGFTQQVQQANASGELVIFSHTISGADGGSYQFSWGSTALYSSIFAHALSGATGIDTVTAAESAASTSTLSISATPAGFDLPLAFFAQANNSHSPTGGWTTDQFKGAGGIYLNTQHTNPGSTGVTGSVAYDSPPASRIAGAVVLVSGGATPPPSGTPPPLPRTMSWFGSYGNNVRISATQADSLLDQCTGQDSSMVGSARLFANCNESFQYAIFPDADASYVDGHSVSLPWHVGLTQAAGKATCPSAALGSTALFKSSTPDFTSTGGNNWGVYLYSIGSAGSQVMASENFSSPNTYVFFTNLNSPTLQAYVKSVLDGCVYLGNVLDDYTGWFADNTLVGLQSNGLTPYGNFGLTDWKNIGTSASSPSGNYAMANCGASIPALFTGVFCATGTQLSSSATSTATYPGNSDIVTAFENFYAGLTHSDNVTPFKIVYNGLVSGYQSKTINATSNIEEGVNEHATTQNGSNSGVPQPDKQQWENLDTCSSNAAWSPSVMMANLDDAPSTGTSVTPLGSAAAQRDLRLHYGLQWACRPDSYPQMMVSWMNFCGDQGTAYNCVDIWPGDFSAPNTRINAYQSAASDASGNPCGENIQNYYGTGTPCTQGGVRDAHIQASCGTVTSSNVPCLFVFEWQHFWVWNFSGGGCTSYNRTLWASCAKDLGPMVALANFSGSTYALSSANLQSWIGPTVYAQLNHVLAFCSPSTYFNASGSIYPTGTTSVCSGTTGSDAANGGLLDYSTSITSILNTTLPDTDWVFFTHG
jgi:hypothetical protein